MLHKAFCPHFQLNSQRYHPKSILYYSTPKLAVIFIVCSPRTITLFSTAILICSAISIALSGPAPGNQRLQTCSHSYTWSYQPSTQFKPQTLEIHTTSHFQTVFFSRLPTVSTCIFRLICKKYFLNVANVPKEYVSSCVHAKPMVCLIPSQQIFLQSRDQTGYQRYFEFQQVLLLHSKRFCMDVH